MLHVQWYPAMCTPAKCTIRLTAWYWRVTDYFLYKSHLEVHVLKLKIWKIRWIACFFFRDFCWIQQIKCQNFHFFLILTTETRILIHYKLKLSVYFRNTFQLVPFSTRCASKIKRDTIKTRWCLILLIFSQRGAIWLSARSPKCTVNGASRLPCT